MYTKEQVETFEGRAAARADEAAGHEAKVDALKKAMPGLKEKALAAAGELALAKSGIVSNETQGRAARRESDAMASKAERMRAVYVAAEAETAADAAAKSAAAADASKAETAKRSKKRAMAGAK